MCRRREAGGGQRYARRFNARRSCARGSRRGSAPSAKIWPFWTFWVPVVGFWVRVLFGYCLMARTLSLMPWNRRVPFTGALLFKTFLSRPVRGNVMQGLPPLSATPRVATSA